MAPGSLFDYITSLFHIIASRLLFCNLYFPIYTTTIPKIFTLLSLLDLTFASGREGIDNPFIALVASSWLFVQVFGDLCVVSCWIDTLVLKTEGNTYATLLHHPFLFKGKPMHAQEVAMNCFWRRCRGDLRQVKLYQVPIINSHLLHYIICQLPLVFLSPTSKTFSEKYKNICLFICLLFVCLLL